MSDSITWRLNADSSQVRAEMTGTTAAVRSAAGQMSDSFARAEGAHDRLLRSSHRVSRQITNVTKDLLTGASAGDIFAGSLEGIARSLNISLGALAALGVTAVIGSQMYKVIQEFDKLRKSMADLHAEASKNAQWETVSQLEAMAKKADEAVKTLQDRISGRDGGGPSSIGQKLKDMVVDAWNALNMPGGSAKGDRILLAGAKGDQEAIEGGLLGKRRQQSNLKQAGLDGAAPGDIKAAQILISAMEMPVKSFAQLEQNLIEVNLKFKELAQSLNDKKMERAGMSLKELSQIPTASSGFNADGTSWSISYEKWKAGEDARRAQGFNAAGEAARKNFDPEGAHANFNAAGEVMEGMTNLKPGEKMSADFKGALQVTEKNTRDAADAILNLNLVNK